MQGAGHEFLAAAGLARDQHGARVRSETMNHAEHLSHRRRASNHPADFELLGEVGIRMRDTCTRNGLVMRATRDTLFVAPPLVITRTEIDELLSKVVRSLDETAAWARAEGWL